MPDPWTLERVLQVGLRLQDRDVTTLTPREVAELGEALVFLVERLDPSRLAALERRVEEVIVAQGTAIRTQEATIAGLQETIRALVTLGGSAEEEDPW
jgi:hypothetical protein